jgi:hypothetical protein
MRFVLFEISHLQKTIIIDTAETAGSNLELETHHSTCGEMQFASDGVARLSAFFRKEEFRL